LLLAYHKNPNKFDFSIFWILGSDVQYKETMLIKNHTIYSSVPVWYNGGAEPQISAVIIFYSVLRKALKNVTIKIQIHGVTSVPLAN